MPSASGSWGVALLIDQLSRHGAGVSLGIGSATIAAVDGEGDESEGIVVAATGGPPVGPGRGRVGRVSSPPMNIAAETRTTVKAAARSTVARGQCRVP